MSVPPYNSALRNVLGEATRYAHVNPCAAFVAAITTRFADADDTEKVNPVCTTPLMFFTVRSPIRAGVALSVTGIGMEKNIVFVPIA